MSKTLGELYLEELEVEAPASRKCLERIPEKLFDWKPHEKSMQLGYLALIVAEIPRWITTIVRDGEIDFGTFKHEQPKVTADLVSQFDKNMEEVRQVLKGVSDAELEGTFSLKKDGQLLASDTKKNTIGSSINHAVHHRGQLTVYMRLNDIPVPSIYGPSADEQSF